MCVCAVVASNSVHILYTYVKQYDHNRHKHTWSIDKGITFQAYIQYWGRGRWQPPKTKRKKPVAHHTTMHMAKHTKTSEQKYTAIIADQHIRQKAFEQNRAWNSSQYSERSAAQPKSDNSTATAIAWYGENWGGANAIARCFGPPSLDYNCWLECADAVRVCLCGVDSMLSRQPKIVTYIVMDFGFVFHFRWRIFNGGRERFVLFHRGSFWFMRIYIDTRLRNVIDRPRDPMARASQMKCTQQTSKVTKHPAINRVIHEYLGMQAAIIIHYNSTFW